VDHTLEYVERGTDRLALHVYPDPGGPVVVMWPAMGVPARYYRRFAADLTAAGMAVVVADLRGTGDSTPPPSRAARYGYADLVTDVAAVREALKKRLDGRRTVLLGHSLGGQLCVLHAALADSPTVDALVLVAVGLPYWRMYPGARRFGVLPYTQGIAAVSAALRVWPGWGFGGRQAHGVIRDWAYTARRGRYPAFGGVEAELSTVDVPVLAVSVDNDRYTPPSTVDHLVAKLTGAPVRREHYTTADAGAPLDHFTWARNGAPLARRIARFLSG
jgi:predicted alpha/beta hydrolase